MRAMSHLGTVSLAFEMENGQYRRGRGLTGDLAQAEAELSSGSKAKRIVSDAEMNVRCYVAWRSQNDPLIPQVVAKVQEGHCVWHALSLVTGKRCFCADCNPQPGWVA